jgi:hypothetical protein
MQYSWPAPMPPGRRPGTLRLIRCARCGGPLHHTKAKGHPRQEDHEQGCEAFIRAMRIIRYVDELKRSASESAGARGATRWRRKYLRESDPVSAISALGVLYEAKCQTGGKRVDGAEKMKMVETLMLACRQLALGQDPAPLTVRPS